MEASPAGTADMIRIAPLLAAAAMALAACASVPAPPGGALEGGEWLVERVEDRPLVDRSFIAMRFGADGRVLGRAACNGWSAGYKAEGERIAFTAGAATLRACAPALGEQEGRFHRLLSQVTRYRFAEDGALVLESADGRAIRTRRG